MTLIQSTTKKTTSISTHFLDRSTTIQYFSNRFGLSCLKPSTKIINMKNSTFPVVYHDAEAMIRSILFNSKLMEDENLLFCDPNNPLSPPPSFNDTIGDITTGKAYYNAYHQYCTEPNDMLCPIIFSLDKLAIDRHGHLSLEPLYMCLGIHKRKCRNQASFWRPLGYVPNLQLSSKAESRHLMTSCEKFQLYHDILDQILLSFKALQKKGMRYSFNYKDQTYHVNLKFPVLYIMGDTEGHDKLCGRYLSYNRLVNYQCRQCNIESENWMIFINHMSTHCLKIYNNLLHKKIMMH